MPCDLTDIANAVFLLKREPHDHDAAAELAHRLPQRDITCLINEAPG